MQTTNWTSILAMAQEVFQTTDNQKAAEMLQEKNWVAVNTSFNDGEISWCLIRIS